MKNMQLELEKRYSEELIFCERCNIANKSIYEYLGSFAAEEDWNNNPNEAKKRFLNVNAYKKFRDIHYIALIGRTGTGKTSILNKIKDDIKNNDNDFFRHVIEISLKDYIREIPNYTEINSSIQCMSELEKNIDLYIKLCVMKYVVNSENCVETRDKESNIKTIKNYLANKGIQKETDIVRKILSTLSKITYESTFTNAVSAVSKATLSLTGDDYDRASECLTILLSDNPILILVDTLELYDLQDEQLLTIYRTLVTECFDYAWKFRERNIFIKFAMPSEIYTKVRNLLPAKFLGREIYIEWNYKDLVKMIAVKFYCYAVDKKDIFNFISGYELEMLYTDSQKAIDLIYEFLPNMCPATIALKFDTLAYCIRHTQKKPRQLLMIIDALLEPIIESGNKNVLKCNSEKVRYLIHSVQEEMIMDSISMYRDSMPRLLKICTETISGKNYRFSEKELEEYIRAAKSKYTEKLDVEDIKTVLTESGIIGVEEEINYIPEKSQWFENEKVIRIINASFEYQIKGNLIYNRSSVMIVHPMCYEYFKCRISKYTMVYPDSEVDPDDFLHEIFKE